MNMLDDLTTGLGHFLAAYGVLAIFAVMVLKESGVPLPIPSDLILITAGAQAATGALPLLPLFVAIEAALLIGGSVQFVLARSVGRQVVYRLGRRVGLSQARLEQAGAFLQRRGTLAIVLGLNIPGARAGIIPSAGLAGFAYRVFAAAMFLGSTLFYGWHLVLGYLIGPSAITLLGNLHLPIVPVLIGLALVGLVGWLVLRARRKAARATGEAGTLDSLHDWTEAACPACLAVAAIQRIKPVPVVAG
jgi:membrane protein DedA with SNARE-associated domain